MRKTKSLRRRWKEKAPSDWKLHCDKLFELSAMKVHWINPETEELEPLGENWKAYREGLQHDWQKDNFDMMVIQICHSILSDPRFMKICEEEKKND